MESKTYINILIDTMVRKSELLDQLLDRTLSQEQCLIEENVDFDKFNSYVSMKKRLIGRLNKLDDGFEKVYEHVSDDLKINADKNKEQILKLQGLIKQIMEKSTKLQSLEMSNKLKMEIYTVNRKKDIKNFKVSRKTAALYYNNMSHENTGQSRYFNKTK